VFLVSTNGAFTSLYSFTGVADGGQPAAGLVQGVDGNFYGTTQVGGASGIGTVFKISADGVLTNLHSFSGGSDGNTPLAGLVLGADGNLYGTTAGSGPVDHGSVFRISPSGAFANLHTFTNGIDGRTPLSGLVQGTDGNFYGTTAGDGLKRYGTVFRISAGGALTNLHSFTDGSIPSSALVQGADGNFYGTTSYGGASGNGAVFKISASGAFSKLYAFAGGGNGAKPVAGLVVGADGNFYGTTQAGGTGGRGTIFQISAKGVLAKLYSFTGIKDGAVPEAGLIQGADGNFYGTTSGNFTSETGTVFQISANGTFTNLHVFTGAADGSNPFAGLVQGTDGNFYGTTAGDRVSRFGTVFRISASGAFTNLHTFTGGTDGGIPLAGLVQGTDGSFYGTTSNGGASGSGTVYKITSSGLFTNLHTFTDGGTPVAGLVLGGDGNFYGTTQAGGASQAGSVFQISSRGTFTNLHSFPGGANGAEPSASLVLGKDGNLYGTTYSGGTSNAGTIFRISYSGVFTNLHTFKGGADGANPQAALVQGADDNFYGTTSSGGTSDYGTVFQISANGAFTNLYSFTGITDGGSPVAGLLQGSDGNFYGTTSEGGVGGVGVVFRISVNPGATNPPTQISGARVAGNQFGFNINGPAGAAVTVQASADLGSPAWVSVSTNTLVGGTATFTDPQPATQSRRFYRVQTP
jgi:uncharacterized repeat protein (TIGR03803 family)